MLTKILRILSVLTFLLVTQPNLFAQSKVVPQSKKDSAKKEKTESFGEFVEKVGRSIWERFNERFNLEDAGKNLVDKKDKILSPFNKDKEIPRSADKQESEQGPAVKKEN